jgi:hypothetical protein
MDRISLKSNSTIGFIGPSPAFKTQDEVASVFSAIQACSFGLEMERNSTRQLGTKELQVNNINRHPDVDLSVRYILTPEMFNEYSMGLNFGVGLTSEGTGWFDGIEDKSYNFYFYNHPEDGGDAVEYFKSVDLSNPNSGEVIAFGNSYLNGYSASFQKGQPPIAEAIYKCSNVEGSLYTGLIKSPAINLQSGNSVGVGNIDLENSLLSFDGFDITDPKVTSETCGLSMYLQNIQIGGQPISGDRNLLNSFDFNVDFQRVPLYGLGSDYVYKRKLQYPIRGSISLGSIVNNYNEGFVSGLLKSEEDYEFEFILEGEAVDAPISQAVKFKFDNVKLSSFNYQMQVNGSMEYTAQFEFLSYDTKGLNVWTFFAGPSIVFDSAGEILRSTKIRAIPDFWSQADTSAAKIFFNYDVTSIGESAFQDCSNITGNLNLPDVNIIKDRAFQACSQIEGGLIFGDNLTGIGDYSFYGCSQLDGGLSFGNNLSKIGDFAFGLCDQLNGDLKIPDSVTGVGVSAFENCSGFNQKIIISDNTIIDSFGFNGCCFDTLELSSSVVDTQNGTFDYWANWQPCVSIFNQAPIISPIGNQVSDESDVISLQVSATDPEGNNLSYSATGLPTGLTINPSTGLISGTISVGAETSSPYTTTVTVTDDGNPNESSNEVFTWNVSAVVPLTDTILYDAGNNQVTSISTDIPANWNDNGTPFTSATRVEIGTSCTVIGSESFKYSNALTGSLTVPNSVTSIGAYAFNACSNITSPLVLPDSVTSIGGYAFGNLPNVPNTVLELPDSAVAVSSSAFAYLPVAEVVAVNTATSTAGYPFFGCSNLTTAYLAPSFSSVSSQAFFYCNNFSTVYAKDAVANGWTLGAGQSILGRSNVTVLNWDNYPVATPNIVLTDTILYDAGNNPIPASIINGDIPTNHYAFGANGASTGVRVEFGTSCNSIGSYAFGGANFTLNGPMVIGDGVNNSITTIGSTAFYYCGVLTGPVIIGSTVTSIGSLAFAYNVPLTELYIDTPSSSWIGTNALGNNTGTSMVVYVSPTYFGVGSNYDSAWRSAQGVAGGATIVNWDNYPIATPNIVLTDTILYDAGNNQVTSISTDIPANWNDFNTPFTSATRVEIGTSCTSIGSNAFYTCNAFTGPLTIPDSVITIGNRAFEFCPNLNGSLTIPNSVTSIGSYAFKNCFGFNGSLTLPNNPSFTTISSNAFQYCSGFTGSLTIPNSVTTIGSYAFEYCSAFDGSLTIPDSVTSIGDFAFSNLSSITNTALELPDSAVTVSSSAFAYLPVAEVVAVNTATNLVGITFGGSTVVTAYLAPSFSSVSSQAFSYCNNFSTVYAKDAVANGWTLGGGQTILGRTNVTVLNWSNYPVATP